MAMYSTPYGQSEVPVTTKMNNMGQKVTTSGGVYDSKGNPITLKPINNTSLNGWYTTDNNANNPALSLSPIITNSGGNSVGGSTTTATGSSTGSTAENAFQNAIKAFQGGVDYAKSAAESSKAHITNADNDLGAARDAAGSITGAINNVNEIAGGLGSYADILRNLGLNTVGIGESIIRGDTTGGGLVSEFLNAIRTAGDAALKINPDNYVSSAASDTQSSFQSALGQAMRNLSRQGVSSSSGAMGALQNRFATAMATAVAAMKTRARSQGLSDQLTALANRVGLFKDALTTGTAIQKQGEESIAQAAGIVQKQGDLFATAGQLSQAQSAAYANIGGVEVNLGNLELSNNKLVLDAMNNVASAQEDMAKFYGELEITKLPTTQSSSQHTSDGTYSYSNSTTKKG